MERLDFAVRYPFSGEARGSLARIALTESIAELGLQRIRRALEGDLRASAPFRDSDREEEIASFAAARMILG